MVLDQHTDTLDNKDTTNSKYKTKDQITNDAVNVGIKGEIASTPGDGMQWMTRMATIQGSAAKIKCKS